MHVFNPRIEELDWIAGLDWSQHASVDARWISRHLHLSQAAEELAKHTCAEWPNLPNHLADAANTPCGPLVDTDEAFAPDGSPVHSHHRRLAELMRDHADQLGVGIASPDRITADEWDEILTEGGFLWSDGEGARVVAAGVAPIIAEMAFAGSIRTYACPLDGGDGDMTPIPREHWSASARQAIVRLAACGYDPARPRDPTAPPTHRIFVDRTGFDGAVTAAAREHYISNCAQDHVLTRDVDGRAILQFEIAAVLLSLITAERRNWTVERFHAETEARLGRTIGPRPFRRAWKGVWQRASDDLPFRPRRGRKPANPD